MHNEFSRVRRSEFRSSFALLAQSSLFLLTSRCRQRVDLLTYCRKKNKRAAVAALLDFLEQREAANQATIDVVEGDIGRGACGVVKAVRLKSGVPAVLKVFESERSEELDFLRLTCAARQLEHPHLVRVLGFVAPNAVLLAREVASAEAVIERARRLHAATPDAVVLVWGRQVLEGLQWLHSAGICHGDLKSSNILIGREHFCAKLSDFAGRCRTLTHLAPEQLDAEQGGLPSAEADVYSLGMTLWELLALQWPFVELGDRSAIARSVRQGRRPDTTTIPPRFAALINRMWAQDPTARPSVLSCLETFQQLHEQSQPPVTPDAVDEWIELLGFEVPTKDQRL